MKNFNSTMANSIINVGNAKFYLMKLINLRHYLEDPKQYICV